MKKKKGKRKKKKKDAGWGWGGGGGGSNAVITIWMLLIHQQYTDGYYNNDLSIADPVITINQLPYTTLPTESNQTELSQADVACTLTPNTADTRAFRAKNPSALVQPAMPGGSNPDRYPTLKATIPSASPSHWSAVSRGPDTSPPLRASLT